MYKMRVECFMSFWHSYQGSQKVSSSSSGQVDFLAEQVTYKAYAPNGQGSGGSRGGAWGDQPPPPLCLGQNEAQRAEETAPPP